MDLMIKTNTRFSALNEASAVLHPLSRTTAKSVATLPTVLAHVALATAARILETRLSGMERREETEAREHRLSIARIHPHHLQAHRNARPPCLFGFSFRMAYRGLSI